MTNTLLQQLQELAVDNDLTLSFLNKSLQGKIDSIVEGALNRDEDSCSQFHHLLACLNRQRISTHLLSSPQSEHFINTLCTYLEVKWIESESNQVLEILSSVPVQSNEFVSWFENLRVSGPGQNHPLFLYLAERATKDDMRYFLQQEMATEAGFDDLIAMTQVQTAPQVKMELAHNYWDEMGEGEMEGVHSLQLARLIDSFGLEWQDYYQDVHWAPLALSNLMIALAKNRTYFNQSIGALGVIELTAPGRCAKVMEGMKRVGLRPHEFNYYALHSVLDCEHWEGWKDNVVFPLIETNPASMLEIAQGGILRLMAGSRCFEVYSKHLGLDFTEVASAKVDRPLSSKSF